MNRSAVLVVLVGLAAACGPIGPIPGGRLSGEVVSAPVADWAFAAGIETIAVETRPEAPYSVNTWFVSQGPRLWIASGGGAKSSWAANLIADPHARLRIAGKLYERLAARVSDQAEIDEALVLYQTKYDYQRDPEDEGNAILFRMDPP